MDKQNISKVMKFGYLKGAFHGAAFTAISGIAFSDVPVTLLKQKLGRQDSIIEMLYSKLQHLSTASQRFNDIKRTYENIERVLRQLESQGENVNGQKILIHQILSKFPLDVILRLEDTKTFGQVWTMELLQKFLSHYVETQENAKRHFANIKRYVTGVRDGESRQGYQRYNRYPNDHNRDTKPSSASVETFAANVQRRGKLCIILVHFVKVSILMMSVINIESCLIVSNYCSVKDDVFFVCRLAMCLEIVHLFRRVDVITVGRGDITIGLFARRGLEIWLNLNRRVKM